MKIAYLTAGAAGMYCGSCMLDNALARAIIRRGHECLLVPLYTPIRTDEENVSVDRVFFGGVNVYLQQKIPLLSRLPRWIDAALNNASLVRLLTANTGKTSPKLLGQLTASMLRGSRGNQRKEVTRLCEWLRAQVHPDCIVLSNLMIAGAVPQIRAHHDSPVWVVLQGDDIFLDSLPQPYRDESVDLMRGLVPSIDGFIFHSRDYAVRMGERLHIPESKRHVLPLGIDTADFRAAVTRSREPSGLVRIGYFARLSPEKGLHRAVDAFIAISRRGDTPPAELHIAGYLGPQHDQFWLEQQEKLRSAGLEGRWHYAGSVDRAGKLQFLSSIDLLCVPTEYREPKGLFALESVAAGTPYLLPAHGAFVELHERLKFGELFAAADPDDLANKLSKSVHRHAAGDLDREGLAARRLELLREIDIATMADRMLDLLFASSGTLAAAGSST